MLQVDVLNVNATVCLKLGCRAWLCRLLSTDVPASGRKKTAEDEEDQRVALVIFCRAYMLSGTSVGVAGNTT